MITEHRLPWAEFESLAAGAGGLDAIGSLRNGQRSLHTMLLHMISRLATGADPEAAAFRDGWELLGRLQLEGAHDWLLDLPHLGGWAHYGLAGIEDGNVKGLSHFAVMAAAAAIRSGTPFELGVPVRDGRVVLPGLGFLEVATDSRWIRLRCDGDTVNVGGHFEADRRLLVPDDGSGPPVPHWSGTPLVRAVADGLTWQVLLEAEYPYLDYRLPPMPAQWAAGALEKWRKRIQLAWEVLIRHHSWAAVPMANAVSVVVPLVAERKNDRISATSPAAFGAIATSWPPDPVIMAETMVHEFQHVKLGALMSLIPLTEPSDKLEYAPWRLDPRPADALLHGIYAHLGIALFWGAQQEIETDPDDILRARVQYARWRSVIEPTTRALMQAGCLTEDGRRFADRLCVRAAELTAVPVPGTALSMAAEAALDHRLTWQLRHQAIDVGATADLASAYRRGEPGPGPELPRSWTDRRDVRPVEAGLRSRLLAMRYLTPGRYRKKVEKADHADGLLLAGKSKKAIRAYRDRIISSLDPQPAAWIGLALALNQVPDEPFKNIFATQLALIFDIHGHLGSEDGLRDPIHLARWLT